MSNNKLYHPELFADHDGTYYIKWMEEVSANRYARFRLDVPREHAVQLKLWPETAIYSYVIKRKHEAVRIETDGQPYPDNSKKNRGKKVNADK